MSDTTTLDRPNQPAPDQTDVPDQTSPALPDSPTPTSPPQADFPLQPSLAPPDNPNQRTIDCLRRAKARILEQDQVRQHGFSHDNFGFEGRLCTSAALAYGEETGGATDMATRSHVAVSEQLYSEEPGNFYDVAHICDWNNREGRTVQDVADLFQRTIDRLEAAS